MEPLQYDPRTKHQIKDAIYEYLYAPVQKQFKKRLDALIVKNTAILSASHASFIYKGCVYSCDTGNMPRKMNRLVPLLQETMDEYLKDIKKLNDVEVPFVIGFITKVLNSSNNLHDYLRVFPPSIHYPIQQIIDSCPCRNKQLTDFDVKCIQENNQTSIDLMKERMVINLLI